MTRTVRIRRETWKLRGQFAISRGSRTEVRVVTVTLEEDGAAGRGECVPYARYGESIDSVVGQIAGLIAPLEQGLDRAALQRLLPAGAARNAVDCALWDLEAKRTGRPVWDLAGLAPPQALTTAFTISLDTPEAMGRAAEAAAGRPLLKVKLGAPGDAARIWAVRQAAPRARLIVDANEGWTAAETAGLMATFRDLGVEMVEQPLPAASDEALRVLAAPVPVCADESCHDRASLAGLAGKYTMVNIKLDKAGGLTEALALRREAEAAGLQVMVGCMLATSLAMAPAMLLAQGVRYVDLDGPLLLAEDRRPGLAVDGSVLSPPLSELWG